MLRSVVRAVAWLGLATMVGAAQAWEGHDWAKWKEVSQWTRPKPATPQAGRRELVRRGYLCIAPDAIGFGERIPPGAHPYHNSIAFYRKHPQWSFMGKMIWDVGRAIDYLETLAGAEAMKRRAKPGRYPMKPAMRSVDA